MDAPSPSVVVTPREVECRSAVRWDRDSLTLSVTLRCARGSTLAPAPPTLAGRITRELGIEGDELRVVLGDLDILLDARRRLRSLEIRTNPERWETVSLSALPASAEAAFVDLDADFDDNGIATYPARLRIRYDPSNRELALAVDGSPPSRWVAAADGLLVGLTSDLRLSELRLPGVDGVALPAE